MHGAVDPDLQIAGHTVRPPAAQQQSARRTVPSRGHRTANPLLGCPSPLAASSQRMLRETVAVWPARTAMKRAKQSTSRSRLQALKKDARKPLLWRYIKKPHISRQIASQNHALSQPCSLLLQAHRRGVGPRVL